jgi:hypothetical protein
MATPTQAHINRSAAIHCHAAMSLLSMVLLDGCKAPCPPGTAETDGLCIRSDQSSVIADSGTPGLPRKPNRPDSGLSEEANDDSPQPEASQNEADPEADEAPATPKPDLCQALKAMTEVTPSTCSPNGTQVPAVLRIDTQCTARQLTISWVDYGCEEVVYGDLVNGRVSTQNTFVGHIWRLRDKATHELVQQVAVTDDDVSISIPSREPIASTFSEPNKPEPTTGMACAAIKEEPALSMCTNGTGTATLTVTNNCSERTLAVFWVTAECKETEYFQLMSNATVSQATAVGTQWRVRDAKTHELIQEITTTAMTTIVVPR